MTLEVRKEPGLSAQYPYLLKVISPQARLLIEKLGNLTSALSDRFKFSPGVKWWILTHDKSTPNPPLPPRILTHDKSTTPRIVEKKTYFWVTKAPLPPYYNVFIFLYFKFSLIRGKFLPQGLIFTKRGQFSLISPQGATFYAGVSRLKSSFRFPWYSPFHMGKLTSAIYDWFKFSSGVKW